MWRGINQIVLTTTLYPVDVAESLAFACSFKQGTMAAIPEDFFQTADYSMLNGTYVQQRWYYTDGIYNDPAYSDTDDDFYTDFSMLNGTHVQLRWYYLDGIYGDPGGGDPAYDTDDEFYTDFSMLNGTYIQLKIVVDSPDEELQFAITITPSGCSMGSI